MGPEATITVTPIVFDAAPVALAVIVAVCVPAGRPDVA
jgi:hypothetical protein